MEASGEKPGLGGGGGLHGVMGSLTYLAKVMRGSCKRARSRKWEVWEELHRSCKAVRGSKHALPIGASGGRSFWSSNKKKFASFLGGVKTDDAVEGAEGG